MARQFIYHMHGLTKAYSGGKKVLDNIHLSFYPDAKIGVLGPNGSGKSTLLRIMAGIDTEFTGEAWAAQGAKVGYLRAGAAARREPQRPRQRDDRRQGEEGHRRSLQRADDELLRRDGGRGDQAPGRDRRREPLGPRIPGRGRDGSARLPAGRCRRRPSSRAARSAASRSARCCCQKPDLLLLDEPTNHLDAETTAWLEKHLREFAGAVLIITHDRYFLDNVTGWILELDRGRGVPYEGNYSAYLARQGQALRAGKERGHRPPEGARARARVDRPVARRRAWPNPRRVSGPMTSWSRSTRRARSRNSAQIIIPPGERLGHNVIDIEGLRKGYGDRMLIDDLTFKLPPGGIVGIIGPNGVGKTTLFRMLTGQEKPDAGTHHRRRQRQARLRRPEPRQLDAQQDGVGGNLGRQRDPDARQARDELARLHLAPSTSRAPTSSRRSATSQAASATACTSPRC